MMAKILSMCFVCLLVLGNCDIGESPNSKAGSKNTIESSESTDLTDSLDLEELNEINDKIDLDDSGVNEDVEDGEEIDETQRFSVIVMYKDINPDYQSQLKGAVANGTLAFVLEERKAGLQQALAELLAELSLKETSSVKPFNYVSGFAANVDPEDLNKISEHEAVTSVQPNRSLQIGF